MSLQRSRAGASLGVMIVLCSIARSLCAQSATAEPPAVVAPAEPKLAAELLKRMDEDQAARKRLTALLQQSQGKAAAEIQLEQAEIMQTVAAVDQRNRLWLAEQIQRTGWPGKSLVGEEAAHAAWLLVQHADADPEFQERCLEQMKAAGTGEVAAIDIAYLTDRVLVARGRPQIYGTQCEEVDGRFQPRTCIEPDLLDQRRKEVGLQPIKEYLQLMEEVYHPRESPAARDR
jgi:hypothetical protein